MRLNFGNSKNSSDEVGDEERRTDTAKTLFVANQRSQLVSLASQLADARPDTARSVPPLPPLQFLDLGAVRCLLDRRY